MSKTSKYRVWVAVPVEVSALDEIDAEGEALRSLDENPYSVPMYGRDVVRLGKMRRALSDRTEIRERGTWRAV